MLYAATQELLHICLCITKTHCCMDPYAGHILLDYVPIEAIDNANVACLTPAFSMVAGGNERCLHKKTFSGDTFSVHPDVNKSH